MRIAISGAHGTGKTTLAEQLADALPDSVLYEEPYHALEGEGWNFAAPPSLADFEAQLERSIGWILNSENACIFDRCPADFLAYLATHKHADRFDATRVLPRVREAMNRLDVVFFVPIEHPDRIAIPASEGRESRRRVDEALQEILLENRPKFTCAVHEITGPLSQRKEEALRFIRKAMAGA